MGDIGWLGTKVRGEDGLPCFCRRRLWETSGRRTPDFFRRQRRRIADDAGKNSARLSQAPRGPRIVPAILHAARFEHAANPVLQRRPDGRKPRAQNVRSVCPYCGVGCGIVMQVENGRVTKVTGDKNHPANFGRLCSKGFTCAEPLNAPDRLASAFLRHSRAEKTPSLLPMDDALAQTAARLQKIISEHGPDAVALYVSGQFRWKRNISPANWPRVFCARTTLIPTRACAWRARPAATNFRSARMARRVRIRTLTGWIARWSSARTWPSAIRFCSCACSTGKKQGAKIIVVDPRRTPTADKADLFLQIKPGTDLALLNGLLHLLEKAGSPGRKFHFPPHRRLGRTARVAERLSAGTRRANYRLARGRHLSRGKMDWRIAGIHDLLDDGPEPEHARHLADQRHLQSASGHRENLSSRQRAVFAHRPAERDGRTRSWLPEPHVARPARGDGRGRPRGRRKNLGRARREPSAPNRDSTPWRCSKNWKPAK